MPKLLLTRLTLTTLLTLFGSLLLQPVSGHAAAPASIPAAASPAGDSYGYSMDDSQAVSWIDATSGEKLQFTGGDDDGNVLLPFPFEFPFYEQIYTTSNESWILVSANGFISLTDEQDYLNDFLNLPIPQESKPNSVIAPFWDDLVIPVEEKPDSGVYVLQGTQGGQRYLAIEWHKVAQWGYAESQLTFEVVLFEDGTIRFQYLELNGAVDSTTVGIEDSHGTDGWQYRFNAPGLSSGKAVEFRRPAAGPRARFERPYYSALFSGRSAVIENRIQNVGDLGTDLFDLTAAASQPGWQINLCQGPDCAPLSDANQNGLPDSGWLDPSYMADFTVRVLPPSSVKAGDSVTITIRAVSSKSNALSWDCELVFAVPFPFAQAVIDPLNGTSQLLSSPQQQNLNSLSETFYGKNLALTGMPGGNFFYAWEWQPSNSGDTWLQYAVLDPFGQTVQSRATLDEHPQRTAASIKDHDPFLAVLPDGSLAIAFIRDRYSAEFALNANVFLAVRKPGGSWKITNLTNNTAWYDGIASSAPFFLSPSIVAMEGPNGPQLAVSWIRRYRSGDKFLSQIGLTTFVPGGAPSAANYPFPALDSQQGFYYNPMLVPLPNQRLFLSFTRWEAAKNSHAIQFALFDARGALVRGPESIPGAGGDQSDTALLPNGDLAVAWHEPVKNQVMFTHLNGKTFTPLHAPVTLSSDRVLAGNAVSITPLPGNRAVLTWQDAITNRCLMYAVVDHTGKVLTAPLAFFQGTGEWYFASTSGTGQGNSAFARPYRTYVPVIQRN